MNKLKKWFRLFPMDLGRVVCIPTMLWFRPRRVRPDGSAYTEKIKGGVIIVSNHTGFSDPFKLGTAFWWRRVYFLAAKEVMFNPIITILLKGMGCIRIDREISDIEAIRKCVGLLKEGKVLGMFPQGGIHRESEVDQIKAGAVLIALQAGAPLLPVYAVQKKHWWQRQRVIVGDLFDCREYCSKRFPSVADIERLSAVLLERMEACENGNKEAKVG